MIFTFECQAGITMADIKNILLYKKFDGVIFTSQILQKLRIFPK
jgi:hypothetical protein